MKHDPNDYTIIKEIKERKYLSYQQIADQAGLAVYTIYSISQGFVKKPRGETRRKLDKWIKKNRDCL